jgi:hypothetical protein
MLDRLLFRDMVGDGVVIEMGAGGGMVLGLTLTLLSR